LFRAGAHETHSGQQQQRAQHAQPFHVQH
jgi:hypothetical protein